MTAKQRPAPQRTAALRARCAAASPRITRGELAGEAGYSEGYVRNVLSDNSPADLDEVLGKLEVAAGRLEAKRAAVAA